MAKYIYETTGNLNKFVNIIRDVCEDLTGSIKLEDEHVFDDGTTFLVYESYSYTGNNRLSLSICIKQVDNTIGENYILDRLSEEVESLNINW
ncbi:MAG: DUF6054 family protein [Coprobacillus sp.]